MILNGIKNNISFINIENKKKNKMTRKLSLSSLQKDIAHLLKLSTKPKKGRSTKKVEKKKSGKKSSTSTKKQRGG